MFGGAWLVMGTTVAAAAVAVAVCSGRARLPAAEHRARTRSGVPAGVVWCYMPPRRRHRHWGCAVARRGWGGLWRIMFKRPGGGVGCTRGGEGHNSAYTRLTLHAGTRARTCGAHAVKGHTRRTRRLHGLPNRGSYEALARGWDGGLTALGCFRAQC